MCRGRSRPILWDSLGSFRLRPCHPSVISLDFSEPCTTGQGAAAGNRSPFEVPYTPPHGPSAVRTSPRFSASSLACGVPRSSAKRIKYGFQGQSDSDYILYHFRPAPPRITRQIDSVPIIRISCRSNHPHARPTTPCPPHHDPECKLSSSQGRGHPRCVRG